MNLSSSGQEVIESNLDDIERRAKRDVTGHPSEGIQEGVEEIRRVLEREDGD